MMEYCMFNKYVQIILLVLLGFFILTPLHAEDKAARYYRNYWYPTYHVQPLNYCKLDHQSCGHLVANRYCQIMGYEKAVQIIKDNNVGVSNYIESKTRCIGWQCDGFRLIRCMKHQKHQPIADAYYRSKRFVFPRFNHYRVDWCYNNHQQCGARSAFSFCRRMGYLKATDFAIDKRALATKSLGDHQLCFGPKCRSFQSITCYR